MVGRRLAWGGPARPSPPRLVVGCRCAVCVTSRARRGSGSGAGWRSVLVLPGRPGPGVGVGSPLTARRPDRRVLDRAVPCRHRASGAATRTLGVGASLLGGAPGKRSVDWSYGNPDTVPNLSSFTGTHRSTEHTHYHRRYGTGSFIWARGQQMGRFVHSLRIRSRAQSGKASWYVHPRGL